MIRNILFAWSNLPLIVIGYFLISYTVQKIPDNLKVGLVGLLGYGIHKLGIYWLGLSASPFPLLDIIMFDLIQPFAIYSLIFGVKTKNMKYVHLGLFVLVGFLLVPLADTVIPIKEEYLIR
ncbi:MAG: hypothetical protein WA125_01110 [Desulfosporosinus sp.]